MGAEYIPASSPQVDSGGYLASADSRFRDADPRKEIGDTAKVLNRLVINASKFLADETGKIFTNQKSGPVFNNNEEFQQAREEAAFLDFFPTTAPREWAKKYSRLSYCCVGFPNNIVVLVSTLKDMLLTEEGAHMKIIWERYKKDTKTPSIEFDIRGGSSSPKPGEIVGFQSRLEPDSESNGIVGTWSSSATLLVAIPSCDQYGRRMKLRLNYTGDENELVFTGMPYANQRNVDFVMNAGKPLKIQLGELIREFEKPKFEPILESIGNAHLDALCFYPERNHVAIDHSAMFLSTEDAQKTEPLGTGEELSGVAFGELSRNSMKVNFKVDRFGYDPDDAESRVKVGGVITVDDGAHEPTTYKVDFPLGSSDISRESVLGQAFLAACQTPYWSD